MLVTRHPRPDPYVRHSRIRLLPWKHGVKADARKRMQEALGGNPALNQPRESPPVQARPLTAQAELLQPEPDDPPPEGTESTHIARHRVAVEVALHDRPQPLTCPCNGLVPALAQLLMQRFQLGHHPLASGLASDVKVAGLPVPFADMREAQKVDRFRLVFSALLPVRVGVWSKLDRARFVRVDFQAELPESCLQV